jgi:hypothetical protein
MAASDLNFQIQSLELRSSGTFRGYNIWDYHYCICINAWHGQLGRKALPCLFPTLPDHFHEAEGWTLDTGQYPGQANCGVTREQVRLCCKCDQHLTSAKLYPPLDPSWPDTIGSPSQLGISASCPVSRYIFPSDRALASGQPISANH